MNAEKAKQIFIEADLLHSEVEVEQALNHLANEINQYYKNKELIIFCVMNGALIPAGMLLPKLNFPFKLDYLHATRYREQTTGSSLKWLKKNQEDITNKNILIIDDILDEGYTLAAIVEYCQSVGAGEIKTAVLAKKNHHRGNQFRADFIGLEVIDRYVFGMGMDYKGYLRHLPAIYAVKGL